MAPTSLVAHKTHLDASSETTTSANPPPRDRLESHLAYRSFSVENGNRCRHGPDAHQPRQTIESVREFATKSLPVMSSDGAAV